jgi:hypothetical protein
MRTEREFPILPAWLKAGAPAPLCLRRFGLEQRDLALDFEHAPVPVLVARVLADCATGADGTPLAEDAMLDLPVGFQLEALVAVAEMSDATPLAWGYRCAAAACGGESEFELTLEDLSALADHHRDVETVDVAVGGLRLTLRRPTGRDQVEWLERDGAATPESVLRSILVAPSFDELVRRGVALETLESGVDEVMDEFDPLPGLSMQVVCPHCGARATARPTLAPAALQRLVAAQERLLDDVHTIALHYHWTEAEILGMPAWRRQGYLARIDAGDSMP